MSNPTLSFSEQLLTTTPADVDGALPEAVVQVCSSITTVRAAYACLTRREHSDGRVSEGLQVALEPIDPTETMEPNPVAHEDQHQVIRALTPFGITGVAVLSRYGIGAWKNLGVTIYQHETI